MRRRNFIQGIAASTAAWPRAAYDLSTSAGFPGAPVSKGGQQDSLGKKFVLPLGVRNWSSNRHFKRKPITGVQRIPP
jgi:hypothetical protein